MKHTISNGLMTMLLFFSQYAFSGPVLEITRPPASLKADPFYKKCVSAGGLPILSSEKVSDEALREAAYLINHMVKHRPDVLKAMIKSDVRIVVMSPNEMTTDIPEHSNLKPKKFWDLRARGLGGRVTSCGEENLLNLPGDRYPTENILIHEFGHCMHGYGLKKTDPTFDGRLREAYKKAISKELWKGTYAGTNYGEYWAEGVQSWFNTNRQNDSLHNFVNTRAEIKKYDPGLSSLLKEVYGDGPWYYTRYDVRQKGHATVFRFLRFYADLDLGVHGKQEFIRAGDMDGDGDSDLVAGGGGGLFLYLAGGRVAEWKHFSNLDGTQSIGGKGGALFDADKDGDLDVIAAKNKSDLGWWENPGQPFNSAKPWTFHKIAGNKQFLYDLVRTDLDSDGKSDEFVCSFSEKNRGKKTFTVCWFTQSEEGDKWVIHTVGRGSYSGKLRTGIDTGDVNGDGNIDIAFNCGWYEAPGDPAGTWTWHKVSTIAGISNTRLCDIDGDKDLDLVVSAGHHGSGIYWFECPENAETGNWHKHVIDPSIIQPEGLQAVDLDKDGNPEIISCDLDSNHPNQQVHHVYVYSNKGTALSPDWLKQDISNNSFPCCRIQVADIDGDGLLDIFGVGYGSHVISYYQDGSPGVRR